MSLVAAAVAGGTLGARHALEADHLAAVATLVEGDGATTGTDAPPWPGLVGASWGVGHTLPIAALGLAVLGLGVRLPDSITTLFEGLVGLVLAVLGARMLATALGWRDHSHDGRSLHTHLRIGRLSLGGSHTHLHGDSVLVGALHGVAGSGVIVIALVSAAPDLPTATSFLGAFAGCSTLTMAAVSALWDRTLATGGRRSLRGVAGAVGVGVGLLLLVESAGVVL
ncbi:MAG: high-affinity nickel-transporter protein [Haloplanus sp.]